MLLRLNFRQSLTWFRFQGQTELNDSKPGDLRSAIEEAFLAEQGFTEMLMVEINAAAGNLDYLEAISRGIKKEITGNRDKKCDSQKQASGSHLIYKLSMSLPLA